MNKEIRHVLITGGTGSLGQRVLKRFLKKDTIESVVIFSRDEQKQSLLSRKVPDLRVKFVIGDIRNKESVANVFDICNFDLVVHTAAMKHVTICEENPWECIQTNLIGTRNLVQKSLEKRIKNFIALSTDKASSPNNTYGYSKALMERLVNDIGRRFHLSYCCIRPGNLIGSSGSAIHIFRDQIKNNKPLTLTDPEMSRFFITLEDAVDLILFALDFRIEGGVLIPKMLSTKIGDLVKAILSVEGKEDYDISIIGSRPGERKKEAIISKEESRRVDNISTNYIYLSDIVKNIYPYKEINTGNTQKFTQDALITLLKRMDKEEKEDEI